MTESRFPARRATVVLLALCLLLIAAVAARAQEASPSPAAAMASVAPSASPAGSPTPTEARPEGTWIAMAYDTYAEGLVEPLRDSTLTVSLLPAGRLEGQTGCGTYIGGYTVDGQSIRLGVISKGSDPCRGRREDEAFLFTQALAAVTSWTPSLTGLDLLDENGLVRVVLERGSEAGPAGDWAVLRFASSGGDLGSVLDGSPVTITLGDDGLVAGSTGCRVFEGVYSTEADRIVIAPIEVVGLPCQGEEQRQDRRLRALFDQVVLWGRSDDTLTLRDGSGAVLLELEMRPSPAMSEVPLASEAPGESDASAEPEPPADSAAPVASVPSSD